MPMQSDGRRAGPLFKVLFYLIATLLIAAAAFTGWIVVLHWDRVGV